MIDPGRQLELRRRFSPEGSPLRQLQQRLLDMLLYIDRICRRENIQWWIGSGTLLGAVRHGGFIPWDDDIDIEMLPADLRRLTAAVMADKGSGYVIHTHATDQEYIFPFAKLRDTATSLAEDSHTGTPLLHDGCSIDLFTLRPSSSVRLHRAARRCVGSQFTLWQATARAPRWVKAPLRRASDLLVRRLLLPLLGALQTVGAKGRMRHSAGAPFHGERMRGELFPLSTVTFEGHRLPAPHNPHRYLQRLYGDYMQLPDPAAIRPHGKEIIFLNPAD